MNRPCELCGKRLAVHKHHLFSNTKWARKLYKVLLDDPRNIKYLCEPCHLWKEIPKYTERQFCDALGISPRSKLSKRI